ncbi:MAG: MFS transporter [Longimicrobiales bacterium]
MKSKLTVLMVTAFIDMVGLLMLMPILPFYAKEMGGGGFIVGLLVSSFAVAQLISAPMWGRFSDRHGRRPALLIGLTASAIAYVIFAFSTSLWLLFLSRLVQGAGGGTVGVIQAYVADTLEPDQRARGLGWLSAATNAGVALGPVLGSAASGIGRAAPGLFAAALCLINIIFAAKYLDESRDMTDAKARKPAPGRTHAAVRHVLASSGEPASRLIWIYAIAMGAFSGVTALLTLFMAARFDLTPKTIGFVFMYLGIISVLTRAIVLGPAVDRFGEARLSRFGSALLALGIALLPFTRKLADPAAFIAHHPMIPVHLLGLIPYLPLAIPIALIPLGTAFTFPCVTSMLSRVVPAHERGLYMGVQQTFGGTARVIFPIALGLAFDWVIAVPFLISATLVAATILLGVGLERTMKMPATAPTAEL